MWQYKQQQPTLLDRYIIISAINLKKKSSSKRLNAQQKMSIYIYPYNSVRTNVLHCDTLDL